MPGELRTNVPHTKVPGVFGKKLNLRLPPGRKTVHDVHDDAYVSEGAGLHVIKGNVDVGFKGTRYNFAADKRQRSQMKLGQRSQEGILFEQVVRKVVLDESVPSRRAEFIFKSGTGHRVVCDLNRTE